MNESQFNEQVNILMTASNIGRSQAEEAIRSALLNFNNETFSKQQLKKLDKAGRRTASAGELTRDLFLYYTEVFKPKYKIEENFESLSIDQLKTLKDSMGFTSWKINRFKKAIADDIMGTKLFKMIFKILAFK